MKRCILNGTDAIFDFLSTSSNRGLSRDRHGSKTIYTDRSNSESILTEACSRFQFENRSLTFAVSYTNILFFSP